LTPLATRSHEPSLLVFSTPGGLSGNDLSCLFFTCTNTSQVATCTCNTSPSISPHHVVNHSSHQEATYHQSSNHTASQSPPWWVHWQHTSFGNQREKEETTKRNSNKSSKAKGKEKSKITWIRQVSDPLSKGNSSTHPRQKLCSSKEHKPPIQSLKTTKSSPCTDATPPRRMHANHNAKQSSCFSSALTSQTGQHHRSDRCPTHEQGQHSDRLDRCTTEPRNGSKPHGNFLDAFSRPKHAQTSPAYWQCMNQAKNAKNAT
jgi:hypothetical protein